ISASLSPLFALIKATFIYYHDVFVLSTLFYNFFNFVFNLQAVWFYQVLRISDSFINIPSTPHVFKPSNI
ncbi:MAG TPA: hypothetical protein PK033_03280, partial [Acetivibrio sp.]|nr:hypothetical protein [Acetivibrio sp.]